MNHIFWSFTKLAVILTCMMALWGGQGQAQGTGPEFGTPVHAAIEGTGFLVVVDRLLNAVVRVDPATVSDCVKLYENRQFENALTKPADTAAAGCYHESAWATPLRQAYGSIFPFMRKLLPSMTTVSA
jgi:hypothetical protein